MADPEDVMGDAVERLEWDERKEEDTPSKRWRQMTRRTALTGGAAGSVCTDAAAHTRARLCAAVRVADEGSGGALECEGVQTIPHPARLERMVRRLMHTAHPVELPLSGRYHPAPYAGSEFHPGTCLAARCGGPADNGLSMPYHARKRPG